VTIDEIIDMVPMGHHGMAATRAVNVASLVPATAMVGRTGCWVLLTDGDHVLVDVIVMGVMEMPIMQVVDMPLVFHREMPTARAVNMVVVFVFVAAHRALLSLPNRR
jgi:hypothetical protein